MVEYAVLLSLIALALVGPVFGLGQQVGNRFQSITNTLTNGGGGSGLPGGGGDGGEITPPPTTPDPETPTTPDPETPTTPDPETPTTPDPEPETGATVDPSKTPLKDVTWEELDKLSPDAAKDPDKYKPWLGQEIGDWILIGVGHDDLADGSGKAGFTFMNKYVVATMAHSSSTSYYGGWQSSAIRSWVNSGYYWTLDADLRSSIKKVSKVSIVRSQSGNLGTNQVTNDNVFLLAPSEIYGMKTVFGYQTDLWYEEGSQYEYFSGQKLNASTGESKLLKGKDKSSGSYTGWTLRGTQSAVTSGNYNNFNWITYSGSMLGNTSTNTTYGVRPCIAI